MAHRTKVKQVPWVKKDGTVSEKKYRHEFSCRSRGKDCVAPVLFDTAKEAAAALVEHHDAMKERAGKKTVPTAKQPPTVHPARRAKRVEDAIETQRQNTALAAIRSM